MVKPISWFVLSGKVPSLRLKGSEVRYSSALARKMIETYTKKGDLVLDPFAGFGTTLIVAQELGRVGYGIEYEKERFEYIAKQIRAPSTIIHGSALKIKSYKLPKFDFCMTSPPYMKSYENENPFSNYSKKGSYAQYLRDMGAIYRQIKKQMKKDATIIVEIENTFGEGHPMTPLAWDVGKELSKIFYLERELIHCVNDRKPSSGGNHSYLLIFRNK